MFFKIGALKRFRKFHWKTPVLESIFNKVEKRFQHTGAQPEIFQGKGGFVKLRHFDKYFIKFEEKRTHREKFWSFFLLDTLKTTF